MIVVSDTSPLNYLVLIDLQHILPELFERILIPSAVRDELQSAGAPEAIARFMAAAPAWLEIRQVPEVDPKLQYLDRGEREAITLAASLSVGSVLIDERKAVSLPESAAWRRLGRWACSTSPHVGVW
jgi:predicted nucleic acid-binding protein